MPNNNAPTQAQVRAVFQHLQDGDANTFYDYVADDVHWTVMGTHALSGVYKTKQAFLSQSFGRIAAALDGPVKLNITKITGGEVEDWAVVEMVADARQKNGKPYNNTYSWSTRWKDGKIVEVRAYLDGLMLNRALEENEG
ncbi:hypothetical protein F4777DRAFT_575166 [Nemania sp. FL0916]|nr:hypothetical protein F4777DRAFT_575166 [Nemania sp. FL0916]